MSSARFVSITVIVVFLIITTVVITLVTTGDHNNSNGSKESSRKNLLNDTITQAPLNITYAALEQNNFTGDNEQPNIKVTPSPDLTLTTGKIHRARHMKHKIRKEIEKESDSVIHSRGKTTNAKRTMLKGLVLNRMVCPSRTEYVFKKTAEDMFGATVDVYPVIHIGKLAIDQYFYESFCDVEKCKCAGVDDKKYESSCKTTHSYTYARIVKGGEIGWSFIKVRTGCTCNIQEKLLEGNFSVTDLKK